MMDRENSFFSCSSATSSARFAEVKADTMMQTIAAATMTPMGITALIRARSPLFCIILLAVRARLAATTFYPGIGVWGRKLGHKACKSLADYTPLPDCAGCPAIVPDMVNAA